MDQQLPTVDRCPPASDPSCNEKQCTCADYTTPWSGPGGVGPSQKYAQATRERGEGGCPAAGGAQEPLRNAPVAVIAAHRFGWLCGLPGLCLPFCLPRLLDVAEDVGWGKR